MTLGQVKDMSDQIFKYIKTKKCKTYLSGPPNNFAIKEAALNLGFNIKGNPMDKRQGHKATIKIIDKFVALKRLSLSYYSMPIGVALCNDSIVAYSLYYLKKMNRISNIDNTEA